MTNRPSPAVHRTGHIPCADAAGDAPDPGGAGYLVRLRVDALRQRVHPRHGTKEFEEHLSGRLHRRGDWTRLGLFYSLLAISTLLFKAERYRNSSAWLVVDPKARRRRSRAAYVLDPNFLFDNFGSDACVWYFYASTL